jgi:hypothetical protein
MFQKKIRRQAPAIHRDSPWPTSWKIAFKLLVEYRAPEISRNFRLIPNSGFFWCAVAEFAKPIPVAPRQRRAALPVLTFAAAPETGYWDGGSRLKAMPTLD